MRTSSGVDARSRTPPPGTRSIMRGRGSGSASAVTSTSWSALATSTRSIGSSSSALRRSDVVRGSTRTTRARVSGSPLRSPTTATRSPTTTPLRPSSRAFTAYTSVPGSSGVPEDDGEAPAVDGDDEAGARRRRGSGAPCCAGATCRDPDGSGRRPRRARGACSRGAAARRAWTAHMRDEVRAASCPWWRRRRPRRRARRGRGRRRRWPSGGRRRSRRPRRAAAAGG